MNLRVVIDAEGQIVGASLSHPARFAANGGGTDQIRPASGHQTHDVEVSPELAKDFLDGRLAHALQQYKLVGEGGTLLLKLRGLSAAVAPVQGRMPPPEPQDAV
jgi:hypothetical protein